MKRRGLLYFVLLLVFGSAPYYVVAEAATPKFTVSATNVTMPSSGNGSLPFTLTSVNGYVGTVGMQCLEASVPAGAKTPHCGGGPVFAVDLTANEVANESFVLTPYSSIAPLASSALLIGFAVYRRPKTRWPELGLMLAGSVISLGTIAGCGGSPGMTPGTYTYKLVATDAKANATNSTTATVTVQ